MNKYQIFRDSDAIGIFLADNDIELCTMLTNLNEIEGYGKYAIIKVR